MGADANDARTLPAVRIRCLTSRTAAAPRRSWRASRPACPPPRPPASAASSSGAIRSPVITARPGARSRTGCLSPWRWRSKRAARRSSTSWCATSHGARRGARPSPISPRRRGSTRSSSPGGGRDRGTGCRSTGSRRRCGGSGRGASPSSCSGRARPSSSIIPTNIIIRGCGGARRPHGGAPRTPFPPALDGELRAAAAAAGASYFDPAPALCDAKDCLYREDGHYIVAGNSHLTEYGALKVLARFLASPEYGLRSAMWRTGAGRPRAAADCIPGRGMKGRHGESPARPARGAAGGRPPEGGRGC